MRDDLYDQINLQEGYYWWHIGRRKLFVHLLDKYLSEKGMKRPMKILDMGCGVGTMIREFKHYGKIWGVDKKNKALRFCQKKRLGAVLVKADLEKNMPFKDNFFDMVLCFDVFEHIRNEDYLLSQIQRILKKDGLLLLSFPAYQSIFSYWDKVAEHYRRYNKTRTREILKGKGFSIERITYYNFFVLLPAIIFRAIKSVRNREIKSYATDFITLPKIINLFLLFLTDIERVLLLRLDFPAGLSLFCLARKEDL